jgi:Cys-tRNA(Pro)/Cys-tRNA(Cys) deacylase
MIVYTQRPVGATANRPLSGSLTAMQLENAATTDSPFFHIQAALAAADVAYKLHEHAASVTIADADANLNFPVERLLKAIAFRNKRGGWLLVGICGYAQVDYKRLAAAVGVNRTQLTRLEFHEVETELGYAIGGVAPFARNAQTKVYLDTGVLQHATIFCGTGRRDCTLEIAPADLVRVAHAHLASLAKKMVCEG